MRRRMLCTLVVSALTAAGCTPTSRLTSDFYDAKTGGVVDAISDLPSRSRAPGGQTTGTQDAAASAQTIAQQDHDIRARGECGDFDSARRYALETQAEFEQHLGISTDVAQTLGYAAGALGAATGAAVAFKSATDALKGLAAATGAVIAYDQIDDPRGRGKLYETGWKAVACVLAAAEAKHSAQQVAAGMPNVDVPARGAKRRLALMVQQRTVMARTKRQAVVAGGTPLADPERPGQNRPLASLDPSTPRWYAQANDRACPYLVYPPEPDALQLARNIRFVKQSVREELLSRAPDSSKIFQAQQQAVISLVGQEVKQQVAVKQLLSTANAEVADPPTQPTALDLPGRVGAAIALQASLSRIKTDLDAINSFAADVDTLNGKGADKLTDEERQRLFGLNSRRKLLEADIAGQWEVAKANLGLVQKLTTGASLASVSGLQPLIDDATKVPDDKKVVAKTVKDATTQIEAALGDVRMSLLTAVGSLDPIAAGQELVEADSKMLTVFNRCVSASFGDLITAGQ